MTEPKKIQKSIAENGIKEPNIPLFDTGSVDGRASYDKGFPAENFISKEIGGIPPWGEDMNGYLFALSELSKFYSSGGFFEYDAAHQTAIGGYPAGSIVRRASGMGLWLSTVDSNMGDPDIGMQGWARLNPRHHAVATGTGVIYNAVFNPPITEYYDGLEITINTSSVGTNTDIFPTLNCDWQTPRGIIRNGATLLLGDMPRFADLIYDADAGSWILKNPNFSIADEEVPAFATQTEVNEGTVPSRTISPLTLGNGFTSLFNANQGYIRFPSWLGGFMIQWKQGNSNSNSELDFYPTIQFTQILGAIANEANATGWVSNDITCWGISFARQDLIRAEVRSVSTALVGYAGAGIAGRIIAWGT